MSRGKCSMCDSGTALEIIGGRCNRCLDEFCWLCWERPSNKGAFCSECDLLATQEMEEARREERWGVQTKKKSKDPRWLKLKELREIRNDIKYCQVCGMKLFNRGHNTKYCIDHSREIEREAARHNPKIPAKEAFLIVKARHQEESKNGIQESQLLPGPLSSKEDLEDLCNERLSASEIAKECALQLPSGASESEKELKALEEEARKMLSRLRKEHKSQEQFC